jgi:hypothetical protein
MHDALRFDLPQVGSGGCDQDGDYTEKEGSGEAEGWDVLLDVGPNNYNLDYDMEYYCNYIFCVCTDTRGKKCTKPRLEPKPSPL